MSAINIQYGDLKRDFIKNYIFICCVSLFLYKHTSYQIWVGEGRAGLVVVVSFLLMFVVFVCFVVLFVCFFWGGWGGGPLPLGAWGRFRYFIVTLPDTSI